jgi:phage gp46-like protein
MADIGLKWKENFADFTVEKTDLALDDGIETAVLISLFTDRRVRVDELPLHETDRAGWWGDMIADEEGDEIGSKLWLLAREKQTEETLIRYQEYAEQSLAWLVSDGLAQGVEVVASYPRREMVALEVTIQKPQGKLTFKYSFNWKNEGSKR